MPSRFADCRVVTYQGRIQLLGHQQLRRYVRRGRASAAAQQRHRGVLADFLRELLSYSQRPDVGAVGAKLYYPDDTIQHAGVLMGINGSAGHSHKSYPRTAVGDMYRLSRRRIIWP